MKKLMLIAAECTGLGLPSAALADHIIGQTFESRAECQRYLREKLNEGREARRESGGNAGEYQKDVHGIRCRDNGDGTFTIVSENPDKFD